MNLIPPHCEEVILDELHDGPLTRRELDRRTGLNYRKTRDLLRSLVAKGLIEMRGAGRCQFYEMARTRKAA